MHPDYNKTNFPIFVCNHGNWDIYRNDDGYCAAIPAIEKESHGFMASHFGNADYVRVTLGIDVFALTGKAQEQ